LVVVMVDPGAVPAANYIQVPSQEYSRRMASRHALMLTGSYIYLELRVL
jgi:hypothetical protein